MTNLASMRERTALFAALVAARPVLADPRELEEIVVTGTRLDVTRIESAIAVTTLDRDELDRGEFGSLGDALQALPANTGSPVNTAVNGSREGQGGDGSVRIDLRGLGPGRTLVLINGRRLVTGGLGGDASADTSIVPLSAVERVEVLGVGTSAAYGADAVAGVVNILTRGATDGVELSGALSSTSERDGTQRTAFFTAGSQSAQSRWFAALEWSNHGAVRMDDRAYSAQREFLREDGTPVDFGVAQTPQGYFRVPPGNALGLDAGSYTRVDGSGDPATTEDFRPWVEPTDRYNFNEGRYLQSPWTRTGLWLEGTHDLDERWSLSGEALLQHRQSTQRISPALVDTRFGIGIPELAAGLPGIPHDNFYNPFGLDLRDVRRRTVEAGYRVYRQDADTYRLVLGINGRWPRGWTLQGSAGWARNDSTQDTRGELRADRLMLVLGPSGLDASGQLVCGPPDPATGLVDPAAVIPGCVPLNVFSGQGRSGTGTITPDQVEYVSQPFRDTGQNESWFADATWHGSWGRLPGGDIGWVMGLAYRRESGFRRPDTAKAGGTTGTASTGLSGGHYDTTSVLAEARFPLVSSTALAQRLDVTAGAQWSRFSSFGSDTSLSAGVSWEPIRGFAVRGAISEVFRAPSLSDLYSETLHFYTLARDPCGNSPSPAQTVNCANAGVPGGSYTQVPFDETLNIIGGNARLSPEEGRTWSAGFAISPEALAGWSAALGYWEVSLDDAIRALLAQTILNECADTGASDFCSLIQRFHDGSVRLVDARSSNIGGESAAGLDIDVSYQWRHGTTRWAARGLATWLDQRIIESAEGASRLDVAGTKFDDQLFPRWRALFMLDAERGPWRVDYGLQYIDGVEECTVGAPPAPGMFTGCRKIESILYHDLAASLTPRPGLEVTVSVSNLTNEDPPRVITSPYEANTSAATYRLLGRTYSLRLQYQTR